MDNKILTIDKNELQSIINNCNTYGEILRKLGFFNEGMPPNQLKIRIRKDKLDDSNIKKFKFGGGWNKGITGIISKNLSLEDAMKIVFIKDGQRGPSTVKNLLKLYSLIPYECEQCKLKDQWNGKELTLQIDHIDGDPTNNELINLRWLCPNCHSQTSTFRGKNKNDAYNYNVNECKDCGCHIGRYSLRCKKCNHKLRLNNPKLQKINWPDNETLVNLIKSHSMLAVGKMLGVTDNTVRKHCKTRGIIY